MKMDEEVKYKWSEMFGKMPCLLLVLLLFNISNVSFFQRGFSIVNSQKVVSRDISVMFRSVFKDFSIYGEELSRIAAGDQEEKTIVTKLYHYKDITNFYAGNVLELLFSNIGHLTNIKNKVLELDQTYLYDHQISISFYFNANNNPPNPVQLHLNFSDTVPISLQRSHVQVPTEIFYFDKEILNAAQNTKPLDKIFINNFQKQPEILWQYYCHLSGIFRNYPGIK